MNCNKYFYFSLGGILAFCLLFLYTFVELSFVKDDDDNSKVKNIYKALAIISALFAIFFLLGIFGLVFGGKDKPKESPIEESDKFEPIDIESGGASDKSDDKTKPEKSGDLSPEDSISVVDDVPESKPKEETSEETSKESSKEHQGLCLCYKKLTGDRSSFCKEAKKDEKVLYLVAVPYNSPDVGPPKTSNLYRLPLNYGKSSKNVLGETVTINRKTFPKFSAAIKIYIDEAIEYAKNKGYKCIGLPDFTEDEDKAAKFFLGSYYGKEGSGDVLRTFFDHISGKVNYVQRIK